MTVVIDVVAVSSPRAGTWHRFLKRWAHLPEILTKKKKQKQKTNLIRGAEGEVCVVVRCT